MCRPLKVSKTFMNIIFFHDLLLFSAIRAESQKLRATVGNVSSQAVTEIKQHWVATNTVSSIEFYFEKRIYIFDKHEYKSEIPT